MQIAVYSSDGADAGPLLTVASVAPLKSDLRSSANNVALALVSARSGAFLASLVQNLPCAIQNAAAPTNKATRTHNAKQSATVMPVNAARINPPRSLKSSTDFASPDRGNSCRLSHSG